MRFFPSQGVDLLISCLFTFKLKWMLFKWKEERIVHSK